MDLLQSLSKSLDTIQTNFICIVCNLTYHKSWYNIKQKKCFFCTHFVPVRDTRLQLFRYAEWYFIKSGLDHPSEFYKEYVQNANRWCERFQIPPTKDANDLEKELQAY